MLRLAQRRVTDKVNLKSFSPLLSCQLSQEFDPVRQVAIERKGIQSQVQVLTNQAARKVTVPVRLFRLLSP